MPRIERICPECGASNRLDVAQCVRCHAHLTLDAPTSVTPLPTLNRYVLAGWMWQATRALTRMGYKLARRGVTRGVNRVLKRTREDVTGETVDGDYKLREWRVYTAPAEKNSGQDARVRWGGTK